jgi:hypothetical protein
MRHLLLSLLLFFVVVWPAHATNELKKKLGSLYVFADSGVSDPAPTHVWDIGGRPSDTGTISAQVDMGAGVLPTHADVFCRFAVAGTITVGQAIDVFVAPADPTGSFVAGNLGTSATTIATADAGKKNNLMWIGNVRLDNATSNAAQQGYVAKGIELPGRYWSLVVWDSTSLPISATATIVSWCKAQTYTIEVQDAP